MINEHKYQTLNAVLFGEGIVNDSVSILLYGVVTSLIQSKRLISNTDQTVIIPDFDLVTSDYFIISVNFITLSLASLLIGISFGLITSLVLKHLPYLNENPVKETTIIIVFAYLSFLFAEEFKFSGIITLFSSGFTMSHYAYYNVSRECQSGSKIIVETISNISESFLYVYLGLSALTIESKNVIPSLIAVVLFGAILARLISVLVPVGILKAGGYIFQRNQVTLRLNEVLLIGIGGIIRGAIAFGLAAQISTKNEDILITTT